MVPREHVYHIEGCQFITEIHILKVRLKMSELLIFSPFFYFLFIFYLFIYLVSYLSLSFIIIITCIIIVCFSIFITLCLDLDSGGEKKQTNKKHQIPSASLTVLQCVEGINMKKQI